MQRQKLKLEGDDSDSSDSLIERIINNNKKKAVRPAANSLGISIISKPQDLEKYMIGKGIRKEKAKESSDDCDSQQTKSLQKSHEAVGQRLKQFDIQNSSLAEQQKQTVPVVRQAEKIQQTRPSLFQKQLAKLEYNQKMKAAKDKFQQFQQQRESNSIYIIDKKLATDQRQLKIKDTTVYFPYEPYEVQLEYMRCVLQALHNKTNALLQSPTGTGKTLCLLASVLSFVEKVNKTEKIKHNVIYMSRTHSQLKQVQKELEKTCYRPNMAIFASRDQLCLKENLSMLKGKEKIEACGKGVKLARKLKKISDNSQQDPKLLQAACFYHRQREEVLGIAKKKLANTLLDIQKMKEYGLQQKFCPYFYPIQTKQFTNLFIMPYNYLLDAFLLSNYQQIIQNSIIIFDEAHNVAEAACEGRSLLLESHNFDSALMELNKILSQFTSPSLQTVRQQFEKQIKFLVSKIEDFKQNFRAFVKTLFEVKQNRFQRDSGRQQADVKVINKQRTDFSIFELFCGSISDERKKEFGERKDYFKSMMTSKLLNPMEQFVSYGSLLIEELKETTDGVFNNFQRVLIFCMKVKKLVSLKLFKTNEKQWVDDQLNHHRLHINRISQPMGAEDGYSIGLKCLVPWLTFQDIVRFRPRSILLTSGTLKPLNMWEKELRVKFPCQLLNQHVIKPTQIQGNIIKSGPMKTRFTFTFDNLSKNKTQVFRDLIQFLIQTCSRIPNGVLLVFPSFKLQMDFKFELLKSSKKQRLSECKDIMFEQKSSDINMNEFKRKALSRKGALLVSICRGKVSQGIDFPDGMCRAVFMVGLPYPNIKDPFIIEKKNHLEFMATRSPDKSLSLTGEEWYFMGTIRAINQALGRVIRHAKDYGMVYLLDTRYSDSKIQKQLPQWITKSTRVIDSLQSSFYTGISTFYEGMMKEYPTKEGQKLSVSPKQQKVQTNALQVLMNNRKRMNLKRIPNDALQF